MLFIFQIKIKQVRVQIGRLRKMKSSKIYCHSELYSESAGSWHDVRQEI